MSIRTLTLYLNLIVTVYCYNVKLTAGINLLDTFTYIINNFYWETSQIFSNNIHITYIYYIGFSKKGRFWRLNYVSSI